MELLSVVIRADDSAAIRATATLDRMTASARANDNALAGVGRAAAAAGSAMARIDAITGANRAFGKDRASDVAAYGAELDALKSRFNPLFAEQKRFESVSAEINRAHRVGALSADEASAALQRETAAYNSATEAIQRNTLAANGNAGSRDASQFNTGNIAAQLFDVGVTAPFMNPLQVGLQQGAQLSQAFAGQTLKQSVVGVGGALASLASPISLATIALTTLTAAGIQWGMSSLSATEEATSSLERHSEWLDRILVGYDEARDAASGYLDRALMLPQDATKMELEAGLSTALDNLDAKMSSIVDKQARIARGDTSGTNDFIRQVEQWQRQLEIGDLSVSSLINKLKAVELDHNAPASARAFATELLAAAIEAQKADAQVKSIGASLGALANMSPVVIAVNVATQGASDAIARLKASEIDLRTLPEKYADDLAEGLDGPDRIIRDAAQAQYDRNMAAFREQERRAAALRASRAGATAAETSFDQWGSATENMQQRIDAMRLEIETMGQGTYEITRQQAAFDLLNQAKQAGIPITAAVTDQINTMSGGIASATVELERMRQQQQQIDQINGALASGFADMFMGIVDGSQTAEESVIQLLRSLTSMAANQAFQRLFDPQSGGFDFGSMIASIFTPATPGAPVPSYAVGTNFHPGGPARVHDGELLQLPRGTQVRTAAETSKMMGSKTLVEVHNHTGAQVKQEQARGSDGVDVTRIIIGAVNTGFAEGRFDGAMSAVFGVRRRAP